MAQYALDLMVKNLIHKWVGLTGKKTFQTLFKIEWYKATSTEIFFGVRTANVTTPNVTQITMYIVKFVGVICGGVLLKYYVVYRKWIDE